MLFQITTVTPELLCRLLRSRDDESTTKRWNPNPDFQRDLVWKIDQKRLLIDSIKKRMPFGMITVVEFNNEIIIIDGKQRSNTLVEFLNNKFTDTNNNKFDEWDIETRTMVKHTNIAVQEITLEEGEDIADIVELFRRINTQSKSLTSGQLLNSCKEKETMQFVFTVFYNEIDDGDEFKDEIIAFRNKWKELFCEKDFGIKPQGTSRGDITTIVGFVISTLTGNSSAITTSFPIMLENGLRDNVTTEMKRQFFKKMDTFFGIANESLKCNYHNKSRSGYPTYGSFTPFIHAVNIVYNDDDHPYKDDCIQMTSESCKSFFNVITSNADCYANWKGHLRKNRNVNNLNDELYMMITKEFK